MHEKVRTNKDVGPHFLPSLRQGFSAVLPVYTSLAKPLASEDSFFGTSHLGLHSNVAFCLNLGSEDANEIPKLCTLPKCVIFTP